MMTVRELWRVGMKHPVGGNPQGGDASGGGPPEDLRRLDREDVEIHKAPLTSSADCYFCNKLLNDSLRFFDHLHNNRYPNSICVSKCLRTRYDLSPFYQRFDAEEWSVMRGGREAWDKLSPIERKQIRRAFNERRGLPY